MRLVWTSSRIIRVIPTARINPRLFSRRACTSSRSGPGIVCSSSPWTGPGPRAIFGQRGVRIQLSHSSSTANNDSHSHSQAPRHVYVPEYGVEDLEEYRVGGYHPTVLGDHFRDGRYEVVHKLGFGGFSTIWLARDKHMQRYVALKILVSDESSKTTERDFLRLLRDVDSPHPGQQFIPRLLDHFSFEGPNGHHLCLVQEPAGCSIAGAKDDSVKWMFPVETARSIAAQLIMGLSYLHSRQVCHGDLHIRNFLLCGPDLDDLSPDELYQRYRLDKVPVRRFDGKAVEPHAPPYGVYRLRVEMSADNLVDPVIRISDYGTSFVAGVEPSPKLYTPALYLPPEDLFKEPITLAADVWTLGVNLYEVLGERALFESFGRDRDGIFADMISTLGLPPARWWDRFAKGREFFKPDSSWMRDFQRMRTPISRPLHQRMWHMGRGETPETCQWDVRAGEMRALEEMLKGMLRFEPTERLTAEQLMGTEYMTKWAMPAWERQQGRRNGEAVSISTSQFHRSLDGPGASGAATSQPVAEPVG